MDKYILKRLAVVLIASLSLVGCNDNVDDGAYYTFTGDTVTSYCQSNSGSYSTFAQLLKDTGNDALLSAYGHYTCFLPDNAAFDKYFQSLGITYDQLNKEEKTEIVYNHLIKSDAVEYKSNKFEEGALAEPSMSDNFIVISYKADPSGGLVIYVNKDVPIIERDIEVHNGVIHRVGAVISPTKEYVSDIMMQPEIVGDQSFAIFHEALELTHLTDSLRRTYDLDYVCPSETGYMVVAGWTMKVPTTKRYGYTIFAEPDNVMRENGINSVKDLEQYARRYYVNGSDDYTNSENALNKFVAYHILDRQMSTNSFLYNGKCTAPNSLKDRVEFYETMYEYHLIKINVGNQINRQNTGVFVGVDELKSNLSAINGYVHSLTNMLVYDTPVMENDVLNCRFRFDFYNIPPELTNNNIRWQLLSLGESANGYTVPADFCSKHLSFTEETDIVMWASEGWTNFEADELKLNGWYDFTLRMLPVPPGSYELRMGYRQEGWRGIAQLFIDNEIQGIPRDLRIDGTDPAVGWTADTGTTVDAENDKAMHNRGYMKAPASIWADQVGGTLRSTPKCLRIVIGQFSFQEYGAHYFRAKNVYSPDMEFHGDYIELIPTALIDKEDIY